MENSRMDRQQLEQRIAQLTQAKDQHLANANAAAGAIGEAQFWLNELNKTTPANVPASET